jgi:hypothetical protein
MVNRRGRLALHHAGSECEELLVGERHRRRRIVPGRERHAVHAHRNPLLHPVHGERGPVAFGGVGFIFARAQGSLSIPGWGGPVGPGMW